MKFSKICCILSIEKNPLLPVFVVFVDSHSTTQGFFPFCSTENYFTLAGWGLENEVPLPDSLIEQFTISIKNINPNAVFPKMIKKQNLKRLKMPVMILLGENEFAFVLNKAVSAGKSMIGNLNLEIIKNASHLISVSMPNEINGRIVRFLDGWVT